MEFNGVIRAFKEDLAKVETAIRENYHSDIPLLPGISSYLMDGGGKRMRPLMLLISSRTCGQPTDEKVVKHACVIEYIHAASLLHDDVIDETTLRRGHASVNSKWGSDASILTGDFLISRAILLLAADNNSKILQAVADAARVLVEGGILEFSNARKLDITEDLLLDIIYRKTASLFAVSCQIGALLAGVDEQTEKALLSYGTNLGMAFQLVDDAMDYDGNEEVMGKPAGTDFKEGHVTLPLYHLYANADRALKREIEGFVQNGQLAQKELDYIIDRMRACKSIEYSLDLARKYINRAKQALMLASFKSPEYIDHLFAVANHVIDRFGAIKSAA